jgi:hypothetical protein
VFFQITKILPESRENAAVGDLFAIFFTCVIETRAYLIIIETFSIHSRAFDQFTLGLL